MSNEQDGLSRWIVMKPRARSGIHRLRAWDGDSNGGATRPSRPNCRPAVLKLQPASIRPQDDVVRSYIPVPIARAAHYLVRHPVRALRSWQIEAASFRASMALPVRPIRIDNDGRERVTVMRKRLPPAGGRCSSEMCILGEQVPMRCCSIIVCVCVDRSPKLVCGSKYDARSLTSIPALPEEANLTSGGRQ